MPVRSDQSQLADGLRPLFPPDAVRIEWSALSGEAGVYSPRVDIAVGPFAIGSTRCGSEYDALCLKHGSTLEKLHESFTENVDALDSTDRIPALEAICGRNLNARCFLAIEIEGSGSRKHIMGGAVNAAALGRVGLSVACSEENLQVLLRMRRYLRFLSDREKNSFDTSNLMILTTSQLAAALGIELNGV
jgi:hypothetical protein